LFLDCEDRLEVLLGRVVHLGHGDRLDRVRKSVVEHGKVCSASPRRYEHGHGVPCPGARRPIGRAGSVSIFSIVSRSRPGWSPTRRSAAPRRSCTASSIIPEMAIPAVGIPEGGWSGLISSCSGRSPATVLVCTRARPSICSAPPGRLGGASHGAAACPPGRS